MSNRWISGIKIADSQNGVLWRNWGPRIGFSVPFWGFKNAEAGESSFLNKKRGIRNVALDCPALVVFLLKQGQNSWISGIKNAVTGGSPF